MSTQGDTHSPAARYLERYADVLERRLRQANVRRTTAWSTEEEEWDQDAAECRALAAQLGSQEPATGVDPETGIKLTHQSRRERWFEDGTCINGEAMLHEEWHKNPLAQVERPADGWVYTDPDSSPPDGWYRFRWATGEEVRVKEARTVDGVAVVYGIAQRCSWSSFVENEGRQMWPVPVEMYEDEPMAEGGTEHGGR